MKHTRWLSFCLSLVLGVLVGLPAISQGAADKQDTLSIDQIRTELDSKEISLSVKDTPFREVINQFREHTSFNIVITEQAEQMLTSDATTTEETASRDWDDSPGSDTELGEEQDDPFAWQNEEDNNSRTRDRVQDQSSGTKNGTSRSSVDPNVTIALNNVRLGQAMKMILEEKGMTAVLNHGVVQIVPETSAQSFDTRFYDVRDLLHEMTDFDAPEMNLARNSETDGDNGSNNVGLTDEIFDEPSGNLEKKSILSNREDFVKLVRSNVGNGGWDRGGNIRIHSGVMVVHQAPDVHREISHLLKRLRQFR